MSGLLRRLTRRRPATADENRSPTAGSSETAATSADAPAEPGVDRPVPADEQQTRVLPAADDQPGAPDSPGARWATWANEPPAAKETTAELEAQEAMGAPADQPVAFAAQPAPVRDLPAGVDPGDLTSAAPDSARRGRLRSRLRYLRHVRELLMRDLGGFTYEVHRTAGGTPQEGHRRLADAKASRIAALDAEVDAIEARLGEPHGETVLREAGIGGTCPECGELYASDARFCSRCGTQLDAKARAQREASIAVAAQPTPEPQPASVLWAGGPRPASGREEEKEEQPSAVTSQWLLDRDQQAEAQPTDEDEPTANESEEVAAPHEPAPTTNETAAPDEPAAADETATTDEAATGEPATDDENPSDTAPEARNPRAANERRFEPGPNGRRDDDVPSPLSSRDPLPSRRGEQAP